MKPERIAEIRALAEAQAQFAREKANVDGDPIVHAPHTTLAALLDAAERANRLEEALKEIQEAEWKERWGDGANAHGKYPMPDCPCVFCIAGRALAEGAEG